MTSNRRSTVTEAQLIKFIVDDLEGSIKRAVIIGKEIVEIHIKKFYHDELLEIIYKVDTQLYHNLNKHLRKELL